MSVCGRKKKILRDSIVCGSTSKNFVESKWGPGFSGVFPRPVASPNPISLPPPAGAFGPLEDSSLLWAFPFHCISVSHPPQPHLHNEPSLLSFFFKFLPPECLAKPTPTAITTDATNKPSNCRLQLPLLPSPPFRYINTPTHLYLPTSCLPPGQNHTLPSPVSRVSPFHSVTLHSQSSPHPPTPICYPNFSLLTLNLHQFLPA